MCVCSLFFLVACVCSVFVLVVCVHACGGSLFFFLVVRVYVCVCVLFVIFLCVFSVGFLVVCVRVICFCAVVCVGVCV